MIHIDVEIRDSELDKAISLKVVVNRAMTRGYESEPVMVRRMLDETGEAVFNAWLLKVIETFEEAE